MICKASWPVKSLGDVCDIIYGKPFDSSLFNNLRKGTPLVRIRDISRGYSETYTTESFEKEYVVSPGDLLIGMDGEFKISEWAGSEACLNQRVCKIIPKKGMILGHFLLYGLNSHLKRIEDKKGFSTVKHLSAKDLNSIKISFPSLSEQKRIVGILDAAFEKIDAVQRNAERNLANAKELFQRVLDEEMTPKKGWKELLIKEVGTTITGQTPPTKEPLNFGNDIPFIKPADIVPFERINYENEGLSFQGMTKSRLIKRNSVLMVCIGASIGKVGYAIQDVTCNQQINAVSPNNLYCSKFIYFSLSSTAFQQMVIKNAAQATLPILSKSKWEVLPISAPPDFKMQESIALRLDELLEYCNSCSCKYVNLLSKNVELKQQILAKAFNGEL